MEIAKVLDGDGDDDCTIVSAILPVERFLAIETAIDLINQHSPDIVIALGVAAGRKDITPEKVAINFDDYRIPDNGGNQPVGEPIVADGPAAYFSTLPINTMCTQINAHGASSAISFSAGTFVCNHLMYGILEHIDRLKLPIRAGFVHVPQASEFAQADDQPSLPLDKMINAIRAAAFAAAAEPEDTQQIGGQLH